LIGSRNHLDFSSDIHRHFIVSWWYFDSQLLLFGKSELNTEYRNVVLLQERRSERAAISSGDTPKGSRLLASQSL
jgi:hypothetical protein